MASSQDRLTANLIDFADTLVSDYDLLDYLDRLLVCSTEVLDADAGGVMLTDVGGQPSGLQLLACTDEHTRVLELFELQQQEGPCIDSHRDGERVVEEDLQDADRWPRFTPAALERGYRAIYAFPMRLRGSVIGSLNLFREQPGAARPADVGAAQALADMATIGILQQRAVADAQTLATQLQGALNSRVVVEQAKGVLAERLQCELDEAFQMLRWHCRNNNRTIREVAAAIVAGTLPAAQLTRPAGARP